MTRDKSAMWVTAWKQVQPQICASCLVEWYPEHNFDKHMGRRHRFDWAIPALKIAVEIDGGGWLPHGGRHGTDADREKLNIAASLGWIVFRFSPAMLNNDPFECVGLVIDAIGQSQ